MNEVVVVVDTDLVLVLVVGAVDSDTAGVFVVVGRVGRVGGV